MPDRYFPGSSRKIRYEEPPDPATEEWREKGEAHIVRGRNLRLYPIGVLAEVLERTSNTLRRWETLGYLPKATYVRGGTNRHARRRLYSEEQIDAIVKIAREMHLLPSSGRRDIDLTILGARVHSAFKELAQGDRK